NRMGAFDAELYLCLLGEQALARGEDEYVDRPPWEALRAAASALIAVGAITSDAAQGVYDDYRLAAMLRDADHFIRSGRLHLPQPAPARITAPLVPRRIVRCNR